MRPTMAGSDGGSVATVAMDSGMVGDEGADKKKWGSVDVGYGGAWRSCVVTKWRRQERSSTVSRGGNALDMPSYRKPGAQPQKQANAQSIPRLRGVAAALDSIQSWGP
ncbi:hypothetical protein L1987_54010 [Smallanthus sonchifolius]|uniref:Uncharacterized protein n=1 Tax=Smallanthus sonchifolius TaxID=185202 RepID=A0ACB9E633_9ASTR|nr:hypothetical protein L1987_54010 [Smallanthus sonchifolius]